MRSVLFNNFNERELREKGYTVIREFAGKEVCSSLLDASQNTMEAVERGFFISNWGANLAVREEIFLKITKALNQRLSETLIDYKPVMGVFTVKKPGPLSEMPLHQDWSLVDETHHRSVSVWLALCDMDEQNGNLRVAPYSHKYANCFRGTNIPNCFDAISAEIEKNHMINLPLNTGDAVVFDHRLIHSSPVNKSNKLRVAAVSALIPKEANLLHYFKVVQENKVQVLEMQETKFRLMSFSGGGNMPPHSRCTRTIDAKFKLLALRDVLDTIKAV